MRQSQQIRVVDIRPGEIHCERCAAILQISAGAKRLVAGSGENDDADVLIVMGVTITPRDAGDYVAVEGVALLRPVDGDPERQPALFKYHTVVLSH